jgi:uncharacterized protein (DUF2141 family)
MMGRKLFLMLGIIMFYAGVAGAEDVAFVLEIHGAKPGNTKIYGVAYADETSYRKENMNFTFVIDVSGETVYEELRFPEGEYVIQIYQDVNGNGQCDFGLFHIPKEPIGITNYNGRGIPGNFNKLKVPVNKDAARVVMQLYSL